MMVRMSDKLRTSVLVALTNHYDGVLTTAKGKIPNSSDEPRLQAHIISVLKPYQPLVAQLPSAFQHSDDDVSVKIENHPYREYSQVRVNLGMNMYVPHGYNALLVQWESLPQDYRGDFEKTYETYKELKSKSDALQIGVRDLLNKCTTVQQALKAWPALKEYLPQDVVKKLDEPETRGRKKGSKHEVIKAEENLDALVALPILIKDV